MGFAQAQATDSLTPADVADVRGRVLAAGSSFYWAMRFMPPAKREALFAIYAFCREVDDIADGNNAQQDKIAALDDWRCQINALYTGHPTTPITRVLARAVATYDLQQKDFLAVIQGMEMDARGPIVAPSQSELDLYCDCVASAVGRLCVHVFGEAKAGQAVADSLGRALQLTNILRDVEEDATIGRLYLPAEALATAGLTGLPPSQVATHARLAEATTLIGAMAEDAFAAAATALTACAPGNMKPAVVMMMVYRRHLDRLRANGWRPLPPRRGLARAGAKFEKLWIAVNYGLF